MDYGKIKQALRDLRGDSKRLVVSRFQYPKCDDEKSK
jgi:hypothetical protein